MRIQITMLLCLIGIELLFPSSSKAWGRHDLITKLALDSPELAYLKNIQILPESIESAAPDLLLKVIPDLERWAEVFHKKHDRRYAWKAPTLSELMEGGHIQNPIPSAREQLLWALEDNIKTPLKLGSETNAADILIRYTEEPDDMLDNNLDQPPYIGRLRESMSFFYDRDNPHTHTFRHYYVPRSIMPPRVTPIGIAPYRAGLYAQLAVGALSTGHPYWGFRFLAWSLHYIQDLSQPWHTILLPGLSYLKFSKADMKREISALHFLTEAFSDSCLLKLIQQNPTSITPRSNSFKLADSVGEKRENNPWFTPKLAEALADHAHSRASNLADLERSLFRPIIEGLGFDLKPEIPFITLGEVKFQTASLDFNGDGHGATEFLSPLWVPDFSQAQQRDLLRNEVMEGVNAGVIGSRKLITHLILEN